MARRGPARLFAQRGRQAEVGVRMDEDANGPYKGSATERSHRGVRAGKDPWRNKTGRGRGGK
jgi:hypothetical protein